MNLNTISTKQLRQNFDLVIDAMASRQSLTLLYRSQPIAQIKPVLSKKPASRNFSTQQLNSWIKSDQLTNQQTRQINDLINRLP